MPFPLQLDRDQQSDSGPSGDDAADGASMGGSYVGGQAGGGADGQRRPGQPPGLAPGPAVSEQDQGRDDLHSVDGEREGVSVPPSVAVGGGELAHVTVEDGASDSGPAQPRRPWRHG